MDPFSFDRLVCQHHRQSAAMAEMHFRFSRVAFPVSFSFLLRPVAFIGGKGEGGPERVMALQACLGKLFVVGRIRTIDLKAETQDFHFPTSVGGSLYFVFSFAARTRFLVVVPFQHNEQQPFIF